MDTRRTPARGYGRRSTHHSHHDQQHKNQPTPRILGRHAAARPHFQIQQQLQSSASDLDIGSDDDAERQPQQHYRTPATAAGNPHRMLGATPGQHRSKRRVQNYYSQQTPEPASVVRDFANSRHQGTQDIALVLVLRAWRTMADDARRHREELCAMWAAAFEFRKRALVKQAFHVWHGAAKSAMMPTGAEYERIMYSLAGFQRHRTLLRGTTDTLVHFKDVHARLKHWEDSQDYRTLDGCWRKWRGLFLEKRRAANRQAVLEADAFHRKKTLASAFGLWRNRLNQEAFALEVMERDQERLLLGCIEIWRNHTRERLRNRKQAVVKHSPFRASPRRWQDTASTIRRQMPRAVVEADTQIDSSPLHQMFRQWHAIAVDHAGQEELADSIYSQYCKERFLYSIHHLKSSVDTQMQRADAFYRFYMEFGALRKLRSVLRDRRETVLQSRAVNDVTKRHDQKHRRVLVHAWREAAEQHYLADMRAEEFIAARDKALVRRCFQKLVSSVAPEAPTTWHASAVGALNSLRYAESPVHERSVACDKAISVQSEGSLASPSGKGDAGLEGRAELMRRVQAAESEIGHYRQSWVDPRQAEHDRIVQDVALEDRLEHWNRGSRLRAMKMAFAQLRHVIDQLSIKRQRAHEANERERAKQERLHHRMTVAAEKFARRRILHGCIAAWRGARHKEPVEQMSEFASDALPGSSDELLRKALLNWRSLSKWMASSEKLADKTYYHPKVPENQDLMTQVFYKWLDLFRERRQMEFTAKKWHAKRVLGAFLPRLRESYTKRMRAIDDADTYYLQRLFADVLFKWTLVLYNGHQGTDYEVQASETGSTCDTVRISTDEDEYVKDGTGVSDDGWDHKNINTVASEEALEAGVVHLTRQETAVLEDILEVEEADVESDLDQQQVFEPKDEMLALCFDSWRQLVEDMRAVQNLTVDHLLPESFKLKALADPASGVHEFNWGLIGEAVLMGECFRYWRNLLASRENQMEEAADGAIVEITEESEGSGAAQTDCSESVADIDLDLDLDLDTGVDDGDDDPRSAELQKLEAILARYSAERTVRTAVYKWRVSLRYALFEKKQSKRLQEDAIARIARRARLSKEARDRSLATQVRPLLQGWRELSTERLSREDEAEAAFKGALTRKCLLRWADQTKEFQVSPRYEKKLMERAAGFRWEKQTRRALDTWMGRSSDPRLRARMAQRAASEAERETRLMEVAEHWYNMRLSKSSLEKMRSVAEPNGVLHSINMRLAVVTCDDDDGYDCDCGSYVC
ncbi:hypothetical protein GGI07_003975 [Coemansia sp. Benny D115]|nr:hypothetical protein GGI07_003975 [Coemansia sp. Benny D115]